MQILVASDLTAMSDRAVTRGFQLAAELGGELRIVHVVDAGLPDELRLHSFEWAKRALDRELQTRMAATAVPVEARAQVCVGRPKTAIGARAEALNADLVVLGMHRDAGHPVPFAETTAGQMLKNSLRPVLLAKEEVEAPYRRVVIGVDFSVFSRTAVHDAFRVAPGAHFHLVHAFHVPYKGFVDSASAADEVAYERRLRFDGLMLEEMALLGNRSAEFGIRPDALETILREGEPDRILEAECRRVSADLIVIGTHGRTGVSRAVFGSVAAAVLNAPPCDVLVTRAY